MSYELRVVSRGCISAIMPGKAVAGGLIVDGATALVEGEMEGDHAIASLRIRHY